MLELRDVHAGYGSVKVLHGVSLQVDAASVVSLVGSNGAGKSTTLGTIAGTVRPNSGSVMFEGIELSGRRPDERAALGIGQVPEGRRLFRTMSVEDNLLLGAFHLRRRRALIRTTLEEVYERFPALRDRRTADAGTLSGGEAQLLAVGRALMGRPKLIILDEPSLGLAPRMVSRVFSTLRQLASQGVGVLLAEQNAKFALAYSQQGYVLERGRVSMHAEARALVSHPEFVSSYLGGVEE